MRSVLIFLALTPLSVAELAIPLGLDAYLPVPDDNPITAEKAALGRALFFDTALSRDHSLSCATCHDPERSFTDDKPLAVGIRNQVGPRRVPTILNRAYGKAFFWDGRIATLEEQVLQPIQSPIEMDMTIEETLERLTRSGRYPRMTRRSLSYALATYIRTLLSGNSRYDRYVAGDRSALTAGELAGLRLFRGKANCTACHIGPNLTDELFHNTGIGFRNGSFADPGRNTVSGREDDLGAFKTPTLREVARRAPYMHDGSLATLEDVIEHYNKGGVANPQLDPEIRPLRLNAEEKAALVLFLRALTP